MSSLARVGILGLRCLVLARVDIRSLASRVNPARVRGALSLVARLQMFPLLVGVAALPWINITVYHVNPHSYGAIPLDMDTADEAGDKFFDLQDVLIMPLECPHGWYVAGPRLQEPGGGGARSRCELTHARDRPSVV